MIKGFILICAIGFTSFIYTDIESSNSFFRIVLPLINFLVLVSLAIWFVLLFHKMGVSQTTDSRGDGSGGFGGFDGGGGDC